VNEIMSIQQQQHDLATADTADGVQAAGECLEEGQRRQRVVCEQLLERWVPLATAEELALRKEGRSGPVIDTEPFDAGLKAGAFVLKVLERLARLDALDTPERKEVKTTKLADPLELARRVEVVSPMLVARLAAARNANGNAVSAPKESMAGILPAETGARASCPPPPTRGQEPAH